MNDVYNEISTHNATWSITTMGFCVYLFVEREMRTIGKFHNSTIYLLSIDRVEDI